MNPSKPTALKVLEGNRGKRKLNKSEPKPENTIPKCPSWLLTEAKKEWKRVAPELSRLGLLTKIDIGALAGYCQSWARYVQAEKYLADKENDTVFVTDKGYMQQVPQVGIAQKYLYLCKTFMSEFGLTPSARGRMSLLSGDEEVDPMEKLFNQKKRA